MQSSPADYPPAVAELLSAAPLPPLGPGRPDESRRPALSALKAESLAGDRSLADRQMAACCLSGLWLRFNFLDESHSISQDVPTAEGSYWHGIMHRREPDYSNAKYWFRRVGEHPVFVPLAESARQIAGQSPAGAASGLDRQSNWDPLRFVDLCGQAAREDADLEDLCRRVAEAEWRLLFEHCLRGTG